MTEYYPAKTKVYPSDSPQFSKLTATLSENCSLPGTDNVHGQISEHIFAPNGSYCQDNVIDVVQNLGTYDNSTTCYPHDRGYYIITQVILAF